MLSFFDFLRDLTNPSLAFLPRALLVAVLAATVCGVVGTHVVLRGMAFIGDAVSHAIFPGIAVAFWLQGSLLLGGAVAGFTVAVLVALLSQNRRVKEDSLIGILFAGAFALGLVIISRVPGYSGSLQTFLFGSITGVPASDVWMVAGIGCVLIAITLAFHKELVAVSLDRESARASGLPLVALDVFLYLTVTGAVVISVQTIGNILVLALLVAPAATARLLTDRIGAMLVISPCVGAACAFFGLYLAWSLDLPAGATIVLVCSFCFVVAWFLGPKGRLRLAVGQLKSRRLVSECFVGRGSDGSRATRATQTTQVTQATQASEFEFAQPKPADFSVSTDTTSTDTTLERV